MQFVANGPDIPETLLQAHSDGRVVFFCGAGISYPAGLPGFKGLVDEIYKRVGTDPLPLEKATYDRGQFDATLDLLERRLPGQRATVRKALVNALEPKWRRKGATDTHQALLKLGRSRDGALRLVTTNFDRVFERAGKRSNSAFQSYVAPMLPIPKNSRWNGLVYLHGLLPKEADESALQRFVLTSGDFGLAYLTERWAARFVSELFRHYVVCFVGYSIADPVLRYMMDALAADRMLGEMTPQAYAFGDSSPSLEEAKAIEWNAKGVSPILYHVPPGTNDHSLLHTTLQSWASTYADGVLGIERIVVDHALSRPSGSTRQDNFVGRMVWALSHDSGLPARRFAEFNPAPSLDWLEAFSEDRFQHGDLSRFGISPRAEVDKDLKFSLVRRPAPYQNSPWMTLVSGKGSETRWDDVLFQIARWLVRHLNDPALIIWLAQRGGQLRDRWSWLIEQELDRFARLGSNGHSAELDEISANSPNAIPTPLMITLWRLMLAGRVKASWHETNIYDWRSRFSRDGLSTTLRLELREILAPKIKLKEPFVWESEEEESVGEEPARIKQLVDWELELAADHARSAVRDMPDEQWKEALPLLMGEFQQLLRDALDLLRELGEAGDRVDNSHWDLPSISSHWQNRGFRDWTTLIELVRDSWQALRTTNPEHARRLAQEWFETPYPTFKRLALFAAANDHQISDTQWVDWLSSNEAWWLWSIETRRETMRLLVLRGNSLSAASREKLEAQILSGPPRSMYREDIDAGDWSSLTDRSIWLHLAKLNASGSPLGENASRKLSDLSAAHPAWRIAENEQDEFSHWMSGTGDPDYQEHREPDLAPRKRNDLIGWLQQPVPEHKPFYEDTWRDTARTRFFHSFLALRDLAQTGIWPIERWREALQAWSDDQVVNRSWRYAAPLVKDMPAAVMLPNAHSLTWWLQAASKVIDCHEDVLLDLCARVLALPIDPSSGILRNGEPIEQPVTEAINHPIGHVTQALLNAWFEKQPSDNDKLPPTIEPLFRQLCNVERTEFRHGRVLLASRLIALFRVDRLWSEEHLLPLFEWSEDQLEAKAVWEGFLWSPRLYGPLLTALKSQFLSTASHYADLGEHRRQFAAFLTYAALNSMDGYTSEDFRVAIQLLPQEGLQEVAQALSQAIEGAGAKREEYWRNRIQPFWHVIWPKDRDLASNSIAESLARMAIGAGDEFPSALAAVIDWLTTIEYPYFVVDRLTESGLSARHPQAALQLLDAIISEQQWISKDLLTCLSNIADSNAALTQDPRYQRLLEYARRRGARF